jgi:hypothetical protein
MNRRTYATFATALVALFGPSACGGTIADDSKDGGTTGTRPSVTLAEVCKKACPADPEPSRDQVEACLTGKDPSGQRCDTEYLAIALCAGGKSVCKDGKTDPSATVQIITSACGAEFQRYQLCVLAGAATGFDAGPRPPG